MDGQRILVAEDDTDLRNMLRFLLEQEGYGVFPAADGASALLLAARERPDLVILDVYLPDLDGVQVLKEIRRRELPVDVIMVTAAHDPETVQEVLRSGAVDYIIKPFHFERIKATLQAYARMHQDLTSSARVSQEQLDRLVPGLGAAPSGAAPAPTTRPSGAGDLPKGLTEWTLRQVLLYLVNQDRPLSASEVADGIGLARVTVRRYLDYLVQNRKVRVEQHYGGVGRPVYHYMPR